MALKEDINNFLKFTNLILNLKDNFRKIKLTTKLN